MFFLQDKTDKEKFSHILKRIFIDNLLHTGFCNLLFLGLTSDENEHERIFVVFEENKTQYSIKKIILSTMNIQRT